MGLLACGVSNIRGSSFCAVYLGPVQGDTSGYIGFRISGLEFRVSSFMAYGLEVRLEELGARE